MTAASQRRAAEMAVIDAAFGLRRAAALDYRIAELRRAALDAALGAYEALGLGSPGDAVVNTEAPQTAHDAATWMTNRAGQVAVEVYNCIVNAITVRGADGMTSDEVERRLHRPHQTVSARINQLRNKGYLVDTGNLRRTGAQHDGRYAIVWAPSELAWNAEPELRRFP